MLEIGTTLREAREHRSLGHADVQAATLIPVRYLQAIEREEFERLPEGLYRRSFLREYAEHLGLDGDVFVGEYELRYAPPEPDPPVEPARRARLPSDHVPSTRAVTLTLGTLAVVGLLWWLGGTGGSGGAPSVQGTPAASAAASSTHPRRTQPRAATPSVPAKAPAVLALTATSGPCWLSVRLGSSSGKLVFERTLEPGGTVRFGLAQPLYVRFGAPWNLTATLAGRAVTASLPARTGSALVRAAGLLPAA